MTAKTPRLRTQLLIGASIGSMLLAGVADAQSSRGRGGASVNPADAAIRAAQQAAARAAQTSSASQRAVAAFRRAAEGRTAMQNAQNAARAAAKAAQSNVPNGLGQGGLQVASGVVFGPDGKPVNGTLWTGAMGPTQSQSADGRTSVAIDQTQQNAILTWDSFNVGRDTDLKFNQGGADWVALNRVTDVNADPSRILGSIKANGTVLILNRNGIIFGGASQVNVRNLVASSAGITNEQFLTRGIYSQLSSNTYLPSFTNAGGAVTVEAGALIATNAPQSVTTGGGYVLLMGTEVTNAGSIVTSRGQTLLSAGDNFIVRKGFGTEENQYSTTRGNEVRGLINGGSTSGTVTNSGQIEAAQGDITLAGRTIRQDGVALATSSVNQRGTIHLLNAASDAEGSVTLGKDSLTLILPELGSDDTALDSQRDALVKSSDLANANRASTATGGFDDRSLVADRLDQGRVEIVTGGNVVFKGGSQTMANGGQVAVQANAGRVTVETGATIDVSGTMGVALDMASNSILVNVQGNELRDSPVNRDEAGLKNQNVWIDVRDLVLLPAGTGGYASDRWYTPGGLFEVGGYLGNTAHGIGEWTAIGGTITLAAKEVVAQQGAVFDISGGSLDYAAGYVRSSMVLGADGRLYDARNAPSSMRYLAVGNAFARLHDRWGAQYTGVFANRLFSRGVEMRWEDGYTVGRDAGRLVLSTPTAAFEGDILAGVIQGERQTDARPTGVTDGYKFTQDTAALQGTLMLGQYTTASSTTAAGTTTVTYTSPVANAITLGATAGTLDPALGGAFAADAIGTIRLSAAHLSSLGLGGLDLEAAQSVEIGAAVTLADGGALRLLAPHIAIDAAVTTRGGTVTAGNIAANSMIYTQGGTASITVAKGVAIDTRGLWSNALLDPAAGLSGLALVDGGNVSLRSTGNVTLAAGATIDASGGAMILADGTVVGGAGGDIALVAGDGIVSTSVGPGILALDGKVASFGFSQGGRLTLGSSGVVKIGDAAIDIGTSLGAGEIVPLDIVTTQSFVWPAGTPLPIGASLTAITLVPAGPLTSTLRPTAGLLLTADLVVKANGLTPDYIFGTLYYYQAPDGSTGQINKYVGGTIPKGSRITDSTWVFSAGLTTIANGDLNLGLTTTNYAVGQSAPAPITIAAGTTLPKGTLLPTAVAFKPVVLDALTLPSTIFDGGFSAYSVRGGKGMVIADDAAIRPVMPILRITAASREIATGDDPFATLEQYLAPVYAENPLTGMLVQRPGVDLEFISNNPADSLVYVREGASISVDPGHSISLVSGSQIIVDGTITAPGGAISLLDIIRYGEIDREGGIVRQSGPGSTSFWIGDSARLDVAARAYTAQDAFGRRYGVVPDGGSITLGRLPGTEVERGLVSAADAFIVIRPGAVLDASGASATIDLVDAGNVRPVTLASNGGSISLRSYDGIYAEGTLRAAAGGVGASGGTLDIAVESPFYYSPPFGTAVPEYLLVGRVLEIGQDTVPGALAADFSNGLILGHGGVSARQIEAGGFDALSLLGRSAIVFDGDITLSAGRSIALRQGAIYNSVAGGDVTLTAPYILLSGQSAILTPQYYVPASTLPAALTGVVGGAFSAKGALIDVRDVVTTAFVDTTLTSQGDLRFLAASVVGDFLPQTKLTAGRNLFLTAQQLYPATGANATVSATDLLKIASVDGSTPPVPYSVFGRLALVAPNVQQGGIVRAPLGAIELGATSTTGITVTELLAGSLTSVSAAGLVMPYGGTVDGVAFTADGVAATAPNLITGQFGPNNQFTQGITITGTTVIGEKGARLDLSGGGTLTGAAFVPGRGGSVDILTTSLGDANPGNPTPGGAGLVFAIVPGVATAPGAGGYYSKWQGDVPAIGQQITLPAGVPGLPAGTYTLLPANYALLPGAFRIELGAKSATPLAHTLGLTDGSYRLSGYQSVANTAIRDALPTEVMITPGAATRSYATYNETGYDAFQAAQAATFSKLRPLLARDGKFLTITINALPVGGDATLPALEFDGTANFAPTEGGYGGNLVLTNQSFVYGVPTLLSIGSDDSSTGRSATVTAISAAAINAFGAAGLYIGARPIASLNGLAITFGGATAVSGVTLESGAVLTGSQVVLASPNVTIEDGAGISTIGKGLLSPDSTTGYGFGAVDSSASNVSFVIVSNGNIALTAPASYSTGTVRLGEDAFLHGGGTVGMWGVSGIRFDGAVDIGAPRLALALSSINIGGDAELAQAKAAGLVPAGFDLSQGVLTHLLSGAPQAGVPAVQELVLSASQSVNFFGSVSIDTGSGAGGLDTLVLNTPAIYGQGSASDAAALTVDRLIWNGTRNFRTENDGTITFFSATPGATLPGGPGSGLGSFTVNAREIVLGYPDDLHPFPDGVSRFDRLMLGFANVNLNASERIVSNGAGSLAVFAQGPSPTTAYKPETYAGTGGTLNIVTALLTGDAGSQLDYRAGGALSVTAPVTTTTATARDSALGAQLGFTAGGDLTLDTAVYLPSGRLVATAGGDLLLGAHADLDLSGQAITFFDQTRYSWGGDVLLESTNGDIVQSAGSTIDISAANSDAGSLTLTATSLNAGLVTLGGALLAQGGAGHLGGSFGLGAQRIGDPATLSRDFAALNLTLTQAGFTEGRSFAFKQGSLVIGDELKAHAVSVSTDGGSLTIAGRIDASGERVGSIRLAAQGDLTVRGTLDAHGTVLRRDSDGTAIDAVNAADIVLATRQGTLTLAAGAVMDLRAADGVARGQLTLEAPRLGSTGASATGAGAPANATGNDIAIAAGGALDIRGAKGISLAGFASYANAPVDPTDAVGQLITQGFLDLVDRDSSGFVNAALANGALRDRLTGLSAYGAAFHLRPGVEIVSATASGNLRVTGDIDLSGYRYGPDADRNVASPTYGAGEAMAFVMRAGGNLTVNGSLSDGFAAAPAIPPVQVPIADVSGSASFAPLSNTVGNFYSLNSDATVILTRDWVVPQMGSTSSAYRPRDVSGVRYPVGTTIPAGTELNALRIPVSLVAAVTDIFAAVVPGRPAFAATSAPARQLGAGLQSTSLRLVAGADLAAANTRALRAASVLAGRGNFLLSDYHTFPLTNCCGTVDTPIASTIRTGAADLDLLAGGDFAEQSIYNISTNASGGGDTGDLFVNVQGTLSGFTYGAVEPAAWANGGTLAFHDGFTGFGALGGGNATLRAGRDAGNLYPLELNYSQSGYQGTGLNVGVASGDLVFTVMGRLNPSTQKTDTGYPVDELNGAFTALRGDITITASSIGYVPLTFGANESNDPRQPEPDRAPFVDGPRGGVILLPGDGDAMLRTRGDLVLGGVGNAGGWRPGTAIDLFSAGGNLIPYNMQSNDGIKSSTFETFAGADGGQLSVFFLPASFAATAASGSIYYSGTQGENTTLRLDASPVGQLELLAQDSIYGAAGLAYSTPYSAARWEMSGANADPLLYPDAARLHEGDRDPILFYAVEGDLVNVVLGEIAYRQPVYLGPISTEYIAAKSVQARAGRDIVNFGRAGRSTYSTVITPGLILNANADDVSIISAGRDMWYTNVQVAGPGTLEVSAGRNIYQGQYGAITSIGPIADGDDRPGASIAVMAGMANGVDWGAIRAAYLDPANLADPARPLADPLNQGKVVKVYDAELADWLQGRYGFTGNDAAAMAYFDALAPEQQRIFLRQVYYAELKAGGREYNDTSSGRFGSYLRGRQMIATLFPEQDEAGATIDRTGSYTAFGAAGIQTLFGGDIDMLVPGGQIIVGVQGAVPPASSGIITQGQGDISLYSGGSILLGLSRIMTTFGGAILGWSATGDINAGRGSKTTLVYTPPRRVTDTLGNVTLAPQVPSTGAGIATLNPIPEVAPGDIDLIAPLGTIDAGEAGIRVSGNVNLAALQVLNAANIQVQGDATGIPLPPVVNTGALTAASSATTAVVNEAAQLAERARPKVRTELPTILNVRFLGFGE